MRLGAIRARIESTIQSVTISDLYIRSRAPREMEGLLRTLRRAQRFYLALPPSHSPDERHFVIVAGYCRENAPGAEHLKCSDSPRANGTTYLDRAIRERIGRESRARRVVSRNDRTCSRAIPVKRPSSWKRVVNSSKGHDEKILPKHFYTAMPPAVSRGTAQSDRNSSKKPRGELSRRGHEERRERGFLKLCLP